MNKTTYTPSLSVILSCKGEIDILTENLQALDQQDLNKNLWNLVFIMFENQFKKILSIDKLKLFPHYEYLILSQKKPIYELRNKALENIKSPILYFIDEDTILNHKNQLSQIVKLHNTYPNTTVIGGSYTNHPNCSLWGRSYNWIASLWMTVHPYYLPAGNLSLKNKKFKSRFYSPQPEGFGGEEVYFLEQLKKENLKILQIKDIDIFHLAKHSMKEFYSRVFCHAYSLAFQKNRKSHWQLFKLFFNQRGTFLIKTISLSYLLGVKLLSFYYKLIKKKR